MSADADVVPAVPSDADKHCRCDECGKSKAAGWALYCVSCVEQFFAPAPPAATPAAPEPIAARGRDALSVACPHCWRKAGEPCLWPKTRIHNRDAPHDAREVAALAQPAPVAAPAPDGDDSLLLCASDLQHSAIYDNHKEMRIRCKCEQCADEEAEAIAAWNRRVYSRAIEALLHRIAAATRGEDGGGR